MNAVFVFGMGYSALAFGRVTRRLHPHVPIAGTRRTREGVAALEAEGFAGHVFDGEAPAEDIAVPLAEATHVVASIAPGEAGDPALRHHAEALRGSGALEWLCYYSTIGVYGDHEGRWIDERAPTAGTNARAQRRIAAETAWQDLAHELEVPLAILRLAGIYGPGRSSFDKLREGTAKRVVKPGQVFNRIHVADIGRITALAAEARLDGVYNLADDEPAPPQDLVTFAAGLAGVEPPPEIAFEAAEFSSMQRSFYADNKRVSNQAIKAALGIELLHKTYREGLTAIHEETR